MLCTIPARAGSKRLPGKNILPLNDRPMIAYSIEAALESQLFEAVYVCTEDEHIAEIAKTYGAEVPILMPPELCGDLIASHIPCQHMAAYLAEQGKPDDTLMCLQPTSPLRTAEDIRHGYEVFCNGDFDFLVSVTPVDPHYFHWAVTSEDSVYWRMYFGDKFMMERLLLPPIHRPNGSIKIARLDKLKEIGHFFGTKMGIIETPEERSIHVGQRFDFEMCEFLLKKRICVD